MRTSAAPLLLALASWSCTSDGPAPTGAAQAVLHLDGAFDRRPWAAPRGPARRGPATLRARFTVPAERVGAGSALQLEGLWWTAEATLNGQALPAVTGGNATAEIPLGAALKEGDNELVLRISPPSDESNLELGGGLASSSFDRDRATLQTPPRLVLRPTAHTRWATLRAEGERVVPVAEVAGASAGAVVRFSVEDDGDRVALGEGLVGAGGRAAAPAVAWSLDRWAPGAPALYPLTAELVVDGASVDRLVARVGVRAVEVRDQQLLLNGQPHRLVGARITNRPDLGAMPERLARLLPAGVNALEVHGELPRSTWLDLADEVGLPVVVVPRCVGRTRRGSTATPQTLAIQEAQDDRFLADFADRPSAVLWVGEGPSARTQRGAGVPLVMWTDRLLQDPLQRPIVQHHLPDRFVQTWPPGPDGVVHHSCEREPCRGASMVEVTWEGPTVPEMWPAMATAFSQSIAAGAAGGVVPTPEKHDVDNWVAALQPTIAALEAPPLDPGPHRASARVVVTGGAPGQAVWLDAPGVAAVGAVVGADGRATLEAWAEGEATLTVGDQARTVRLTPGQWRGLERTGGVTEVAL